MIAHNAVGESNRQRIEALARVPGLEVALLTPPWWFEEGRRIEVRDEPRHARAFAWRVGRTLATGNGTRHVYRDALFRFVREFQPDVLDVHEEPFSFAAAQALLARDRLAPRAAYVFCSYVNVHVRWRLPYALAERLVLARADGAYAPNADVPGVLRAKGMRGPVAVVPTGVDVARFAGAAPRDLAPALGDAPRPYIGFLGRLEPVKGLDYLLQAAAGLRAPGTIVIAGDGPERPRLQAQARALGLGARVRFLPGMPFGEVPGFLRALDALVLPSVTIPPLFKEQFGRVLTEAMAAGVPVLGSSSGAIPEVVGDAGLVVPERNAVALRDALDRLLAEPDLRADLARRGRERVGRYYAWPVVARQAAAVYKAALRRRRGGAADATPAEAGLEVPV